MKPTAGRAFDSRQLHDGERPPIASSSEAGVTARRDALHSRVIQWQDGWLLPSSRGFESLPWSHAHVLTVIDEGCNPSVRGSTPRMGSMNHWLNGRAAGPYPASERVRLPHGSPCASSSTA